MQYTLDVYLYNEYDEIVDSYSQTVDAYVNDNGVLDAMFELNDRRISLTEMRNIVDSVNTRVWWIVALAVVGVVVAIVVVMNAVEKSIAQSNYNHNLSLEANKDLVGSTGGGGGGGGSGKNDQESMFFRGVNNAPTMDGVYQGFYITRQQEANKNGYKSNNYKVGLAKFGDVGCGIAAVYNMMVAREETKIYKQYKYLSHVIYVMEMYSITISLGLGYFGSNPFEIYKYLDKESIKYTQHIGANILTGANSLDRAVFDNALANAPIGTQTIICTWNSTLTKGGHLFFAIKTIGKDDKGNSAIVYRSYNMIGSVSYYDVFAPNELKTGTTFLSGYIIQP
ncbi:MAG: hypothetical protein LBK70_03200 [Clostridiales bacterium]|nr:hypothetical protein [Clostridiales bacterium]